MKNWNEEGITKLLNTLVAPQFEVIRDITLDWQDFGDDDEGWYSKINVNLNHPVKLNWENQTLIIKAVLDGLKYLGISGTDAKHIIFN
jgi:hypothetical protein